MERNVPGTFPESIKYYIADRERQVGTGHWAIIQNILYFSADSRECMSVKATATGHRIIFFAKVAAESMERNVPGTLQIRNNFI